MKYLLLSLFLALSAISCNNEGGDGNSDDKLTLNFNLEYGDEPLVMFKQYKYPEGNNIYFSRISFYLSSIAIINDDTPEGVQFELEDVTYVDLTNAHASEANAEKGLTISYTLPTQNIDQVFMRVGLNSIQNSTIPTDYTSDNDLSLAGEYWPGWESYIFAKIEGMIDLDGDGNLEQPIALHLGSDEAKRELISAQLNNANDLDIVIDIKKIFEYGGDIYDIAAVPQIHTIDDVNSTDAINFLATGLIQSFDLNF